MLTFGKTRRALRLRLGAACTHVYFTTTVVVPRVPGCHRQPPRPPFSRGRGAPAHRRHGSIARRRSPRQHQPPLHESALLLAPAGAAGCEQRGARACSTHSCGHVPDRPGCPASCPPSVHGLVASRRRALLRSRWQAFFGSLRVFIGVVRGVACSTLASAIGALTVGCNRCARCTLHTRASGALPLASQRVAPTRWRRATSSCTWTPTALRLNATRAVYKAGSTACIPCNHGAPRNATLPSSVANPCAARHAFVHCRATSTHPVNDDSACTCIRAEENA